MENYHLDSEIVAKEVSEWLKERIMKECTSEYASLIVIVRKKDGSS